MAQKKHIASKFGERLRIVRKESGMSLESIAERVNNQFDAHINKGMLSKYENGINEPSAGMVHCIASVLNVSGEYLTGKSDERTEVSLTTRTGVSGAVPVQVFSIITGDSFTPEEGKSVLIPYSALAGGREYFALRIKGGRLAPRFQNGDIVIFEKRKRFPKGAVILVSVGGGMAVMCNVINKRNGKVIRPLDPAYDEQFYTTEQIYSLPVKLIGLATELRREKLWFNTFFSLLFEDWNY